MDFDLGGYQSLGAAYGARIARHPGGAAPTVSRRPGEGDHESPGSTEPVRPTPSREPDPRVRCLVAGGLA
ncbi:hypothetical protein [Kitasatospora purpeofusca]|uniref:hypothetical protein n=1 Tax=Kitasatospora purpeofusca TaxID=67352 RepID=UPI003829ADCC